MSFTDQRLHQNQEHLSAILMGVYLAGTEKQLCLDHLEELKSLGDTYGIETKGYLTALLHQVDASTYIHKGKVEEIKQMLEKHNANLVIFDDEISPAQQRNLEKILHVPVIDRTELILEIFGQRAHSKEAKLQIELANLKYSYPRLKHLWSHFSRQRASGGYLKGAGEKQIEVDRRLIQRRKQRLQKELKEVEKYRLLQKEKRLQSKIPTFAIIGYTNAGKSTLLKALTDADLFVEDKLFATLDPTTRKYTLPNHQEILMTDTVGFIRKLPHTLVEAFKSTLEAALHDDVLIHVIDVSHPQAKEHAETTLELLKELKADQDLVITVLNKVDQCDNTRLIQQMKLSYPRVVAISALKKQGFEDLLEKMSQVIAFTRVKVSLRIPQKDYAYIALLQNYGIILEQTYEDNDVLITAEIPKRIQNQFQPFLNEELIDFSVHDHEV